MQIQLGKLLLWYLVFVGIPYLIAKRIEKFLLNRLDSETKTKLNEELKRFPDINNVSEKTQNELGRRGGADLVTLWFTKVFVLDFAAKVAIGRAIGTTLWENMADNAAANLVRFGTAMLQSPGNKFKNYEVLILNIRKIYKKFY